MDYINISKSALDVQIEALQNLKSSLNEELIEVVNILLNVKGRIVFSGVGKSGLIAQKIASVFSSIGSSAFFIHSSEASHGDLGAISDGDVVVVLSNSGSTKELLDTISYCKRKQIQVIAIVGRKNSALYEAADFALLLPKFFEIDQDIAFPSTSITIMSVIGDLLALCLVKAKNVTKDEYRTFHPGGSIGNSLLTIKELMRKGHELPIVRDGTKVLDAMLVMSEKSIGCMIVLDKNDQFCGIVTDGDLRRSFDHNFPSKNVEDIMTKNPKSISGELRALDALNYMNDNNVTQLMVFDKSGKVAGLLHMHDCLRAGLSIENE